MADPVSILAVAGLAYVGRRLSERNLETYEPEQPRVYTPKPPVELKMPEILSEVDERVPIRKIETTSFADISPQKRTNGGEMLTMRNRMYDTGRMNNLSPVEKQLVGPGIGIEASVPAAGGYQQLLRVNPENVGAYRLTTLPGRTGPAADTRGGRRGVMGQFAQNRPEKTVDLASRRPEVFGRAQGMTGVVPRGEHEHTKRLTNRSETGSRNDTLGFAGAKRIVSGTTLAMDPTRNKKDGNIEQYQYNNMPGPDINHYAHGYLNAPGVKIGESRVYGTPHTVAELNKYGFRPDDRRGKANRVGNGGRMNVRAGPLNQGGMPTTLRTDTTRIDGRVNPVAGGWTQQYKNDSYHQLNAHKGHMNPLAHKENLNTAKKQLANNPYAQQYW